MFIGEYSYNIDAKGRLAIPVKFRAKLSGGAVVTRGLDNCLFLYSKEEWEKLAERLSSLPLSQPNARAFSRLMLAGAMDVEMDKQGRVIIPAYLREFAQLKSTVVIAGLYSRLEIWQEEAWKNYKKTSEKETSNLAEQLTNLGV